MIDDIKFALKHYRKVYCSWFFACFLIGTPVYLFGLYSETVEGTLTLMKFLSPTLIYLFLVLRMPIIITRKYIN